MAVDDSLINLPHRFIESARSIVVPEGVPKNPNEELLKIIRRIASKAPSIAEKFNSSLV